MGTASRPFRDHRASYEKWSEATLPVETSGTAGCSARLERCVLMSYTSSWRFLPSPLVASPQLPSRQ